MNEQGLRLPSSPSFQIPTLTQCITAGHIEEKPSPVLPRLLEAPRGSSVPLRSMPRIALALNHNFSPRASHATWKCKCAPLISVINTRACCLSSRAESRAESRRGRTTRPTFPPRHSTLPLTPPPRPPFASFLVVFISDRVPAPTTDMSPRPRSNRAIKTARDFTIAFPSRRFTG